MCNPVLAVAAISAVTTTVGVVEQAHAAHVQRHNLKIQQQQKSDQIKQRATADLFDVTRAAQRERARIRTASAQSGLNISSNSIESLLLNSQFQEGLNKSRILKNAENSQAASTTSTNVALSRLPNTSALSAGLKIVGNTASTYIKAQHNPNH